MRNQRTTTIIAAVAVVLVAVLVGSALWFGQHTQAWTGTACEQIRSAIAWTEGRMALEPEGTDAYAALNTTKGDLVGQLADAKCPTDAPAPPPTGPCKTHFFTNDKNKVSLRAFGPAVKDTGVAGVSKEYFRRLQLDPALLAENLNVLGIRQDSQAGQQKLAEKLVKDCTARTKYVQQIRDLLDKSKASIVKPGAQRVGSAYMVDGPNGVPLLEWDNSIWRGKDYVIFQIVLPSGQKVWLRLACGFQYDKPGAPSQRRSVSDAPACVSGKPRDNEGNCPPPRDKPPRTSTTTRTTTSTTTTTTTTSTTTTTATTIRVCRYPAGGGDPSIITIPPGDRQPSDENPLANGTCPKHAAPQPTGVESVPGGQPTTSASPEPTPTG